MLKLSTKNIILIINAFMNILGAYSIEKIGIGAISELVLWNILMIFVFSDEHYRIKKQMQSLLKRARKDSE